MILPRRRSRVEAKAGRIGVVKTLNSAWSLFKLYLIPALLFGVLTGLGLFVGRAGLDWRGIVEFPDRLGASMAAAWPASDLALVAMVISALFVLAGLDIRSTLSRRKAATAEAASEDKTVATRTRGTGARGRLALAGRALNFGVMAVALLALAGVAGLVAGPKIIGWQEVIVLSGSMEPALPTGGLAFVQPLPASEIEVDDILTHRPNPNSSTLITHRVIEKIDGPDGLVFRTKGDANEVADLNLIPAANVVGRVVFDVPYVGHLVDGLRDRSTFYLLVGIPAVLLILNELWNIGTDLRGASARARRVKEQGVPS